MTREALESDVPALVAMGVRFVQESPYSAFLLLNPGAIESLMRALVTGQGGTVFVSTTPEGELTGMLGVGIFTDPMSHELGASELFWWVQPEHRKSMDAGRLFLTAETWAQEQGAKFMQMVAPVGSTEVEAMYVRHDYSPVQVMYQRRFAA